MEHKLEWLTEEEGVITFYENGTTFLTVKAYVTGEEEAEFQLQDIVFPEKEVKNTDMQEEVISKMTDCISESFRLLWEEGFEETILVERHGTKMADLLDSTCVVQKIYSEFMMSRRLEPQKSTGCGLPLVKLTKDESGYCCENEEKTFFCRLLSYRAEKSAASGFYLYEVEVDKKKRNQGIATACLTELFRLLSENAPVMIYLQVGSYNEPAVHLYKKLGFQVSEELCYYTWPE